MQLVAVGRTRVRWSRLSGVDRPVLILHGDADLIVPPENADVSQRAIPARRCSTLPGAGHIFTTDATMSPYGDA